MTSGHLLGNRAGELVTGEMSRADHGGLKCVRPFCDEELHRNFAGAIPESNNVAVFDNRN